MPVVRRSRSRLTATVVAIALAMGPPLRSAPEAIRGRPLVEVLRDLQERGVRLLFSSAVVSADLRVPVEPTSTEPRALLDEILPPLGLAAEDGPAGTIRIVPRAPPVGTLTGRVRSTIGGGPVAGARIRVAAPELAAMSGVDGSFAIREIPAGRAGLEVEALGYLRREIPEVLVEDGRTTRLTIDLVPEPGLVTDVVVTPGRHSIVREEQSPSHALSGDEVLLAPTFGGDPSRVVELLPGIAAPDNSAAFHPRGGAARDVSWVLDGLELYDPFHLQSYQSPFSLIDANVVDRIDFLGGGFTAERGDRNGGFVEISTLAPDDAPEGGLELGTLNSRGAYGAPLPSRSGSWLVAARGWYPEAVRTSTEIGKGERLSPRLLDVYAKSRVLLTPRHLLSFHLLGAYDRLRFVETGEDVNERVDARTRSGHAWVRSLAAWTERLSTESVLSGGRIERSRGGLSSAGAAGIRVEDDRLVEFFGLRHDLRWWVSPEHLVKIGFDLRRLDGRYRYTREELDDPSSARAISLDPGGSSIAVYVSHRFRVHAGFAVETGLRWDRQSYTADDAVSPRLNATWRPDERSELRVALGRFRQSQRIHELDVEDGETDFMRAEIADQAEVSWQRRIGERARVRVDAYARRLSDPRPRYENLFEPIELFPETTEDRVRVAPASARARGIEIVFRSEPGRPWFWWASYSRSRVVDRIDGRDVPRSWDQPHALSFLTGYRKEARWAVSVAGILRSGWPTTPVAAEEVTLPDGSTEFETVPGDRNADRFPRYFRIDLKVRRAVSVPRGRLWLTLDVANATDRENPCCVDEFVIVPSPGGGAEVVPRRESWLGITPSLSVLWEF